MFHVEQLYFFVTLNLLKLRAAAAAAQEKKK
jgi:hypothetical protein